MNSYVKNVREATAFLPDRIRYPISVINQDLASEINEIRIKRLTPVMIVTSDKRCFLKYDGTVTTNPNDKSVCLVEQNDMDDAVRKLCNYSLHAFQNELKNGFITVSGGHRVGISATAVTNAQGEITAIKNISSLNIRIAREVAGAADEIISNVFYDRVRSVLIVGEPSSGKTTVLRDLAGRLSGSEFNYLRVCVVDERSEIAATSGGISKNKIGVSCDVLDGYPKADGMMIALRAMAPDVIVCDEIGSEKDVVAIESIANAGTKLIASIHAESFSHLLKRPQFQKLMSTSVFETAVVLKGKDNPGKVKDIVPLKRYWR
ncbi:MAG: stage III sporulation protein AA [Oscillospiraceae bacterium]|nr:stage III sporulation protein AA [Oscillospiraceae bacterium]